ncbi:hypothetical protein LXL04_006803 [Taraxacum kok-saghyz]
MRVNPSICNQGPKTQTIQTKPFLAKNPSTTQQTIPLKPSTTHAKPLLSSPAEGSKPSRKDDVRLQLSSPAIQLSSPAAKQATCPADKTTGPLTPTATSILEANTSHASKYKARWNGGDKYQVTGVWQDQHVVDVRNNNCSCRKWELIGIPCKHAIATLNEMTKNSEDVTNIYRWVNKVYWLDTWKEAYSYKVHPIKGRIMWPKSLCPTKLTPPPHHTQVGRPKKKRNKTEDERMSRSQRGSSSQANNQDEGIRVGKDGAKKLTRKYGKVTCSKCKNTGHNARSCTGR